MEKNVKRIVRGSLIFLGVLFFVFAGLNVWGQVAEAFDEGVLEGLVSFFSVDFSLFLVFLVLGYFVFNVGVYWTNFFKAFSKTLVGIALFFVTCAFFMLPMDASVIAGCIQPTIDYMVVSSIDDVLDSQIVPYDKDLKVVLAENVETQMIFSENITQEQVALIVNELDLSMGSYEKEKILCQFLITIVYDNMQSQPENVRSVPIALSQVKEIMSSQIDKSVFESMDANLLKQFYVPSAEAHINILISNNSITKTINQKTLTEEDACDIWHNLGLNENISVQTKMKAIKLIISQLGPELESQSGFGIGSLEGISIPLASLKYSLPEEANIFSSYDILSDNMSVRIEALNEIRLYCFNQTNEICDMIMMTEYDNLMKVVMNSSSEVLTELNVSLNLSDTLEPYSTIEKVEDKIDGFNLGVPFVLIAIVIFGFALVSYYLHFILFNRELVNLHIPYYIAKVNLIQYIPSMILIYVVCYVIKSEVWISFVESLIGPELGVSVAILKEISIYHLILDINVQALNYAFIYLGISVFVYVLFYFLLKRELEN